MTWRVLDLFSGIGGFSLGLERAGFQTVAFCEINAFCRRVLAKHWPNVPCSEDVTTRKFVRGEADVVTAGFPCQDISYAGEGAGLAGARSGLYREVVRAIRLVRPKWALLENVAALLSRGLGTVLGDLAEIGYDAEWHCIPASAVGAPHRRDRIWIVADARGKQHKSRRAPLSGKIAEELSRSFADAAAVLGVEIERLEPNGDHARLGEMADAERIGERAGLCADRQAELGQGRSCDGSGEANGSDASEPRLSSPELENLRGARRREEGRAASERGWWAFEPDVGRVAHGVPARVDRLSSLGNAVIPQIPEIIGRAIREAEEEAMSEAA